MYMYTFLLLLLLPAIDYVFAQFCGIHLSSSVFFLAYIVYRRNVPHVYPRVIFPAVISGLMWGVANALWFIANKTLSEPVSFPIISTIPMGVSLLVGILLFKEITVRLLFVWCSSTLCQSCQEVSVRLRQ